MNSKIRDENVDFLFEAILTLKSVDECYEFFEDLCTIKEIKAMAQRLVVAKMLTEKCVYSDIVAKTGVSTATKMCIRDRVLVKRYLPKRWPKH